MASIRRLQSLQRFLAPSYSAVSSTRTFVTSLGSPVDLAFEKVDPPEVKSQSPLLIVHGLYGSKQNWRSLSKAFARNLGRPVYALDLRNHGESPHAEAMDYATLAGDILHFCETKSLSRISLIAHSLGGKVAMAFALSPSLPNNLLSHLVVVDISPAVGPISPEFRSYIGAMKEVDAAGVQSKKQADEILKNYESDPSVRAFLLHNLVAPTKGEPLRFRIPLDTIEKGIDGIGDFPYTPGQEKWEGPAMFVKGAKSKYINRRNTPVIEQYFPKARIEQLDTGHWVHAEKPREFVELVSEFVSRK